MRSKTTPTDCEIIRTYDELRSFRDAFFAAAMYFLLIIGRHGLSKSYEFQDRCWPYKDCSGHDIDVAHYVKGNITPVEAYRLAFEHRNKLLIFDDAERLWADVNGRFLLRDLTENKPTKTVHWRVDNKALERDSIAKQFDTTSRICLIMNRFAFGDAAEYAAIADRAHMVYFDPTVVEVHRNAALWFWDQEIYDFVGQHLGLIDPDKLSARTYVKAYERRQKGDWRKFLENRYFSQETEKWVVSIENDARFRTAEQKVAEFEGRTGLKRATYFNVKKQLKKDGQLKAIQVPVYTLNARPPEVPDLEAEVRRAEEERRLAEQQRLEQLRLQEEEEYRELEDRHFGDDEDQEEDE
jgi:hypothetical protein